MLFLLLILGLGGDEPIRNYKLFPIDPPVAMAFDANRQAPWASDWSSTLVADLPPGFVPAPTASDYSSSILVAQAAPQGDLEQENLELRQRIEQLENLIKDTVNQPPVPGPQPVIPTSGTKSVPGWLVEFHEWNKGGHLNPDPLKVALTRNCSFQGNFGHEHRNQMYIYRFLGTFRVKEQGRYVFGSDTTCGFNHECGFEMFVDGSQIIDFAGRTEGEQMQLGLPMSVGDHTVEIRTWIDHNSFINYRPTDNHKWWPNVKGPGELNARDFREDELFAVVPADTRGSVLSCSY